MFIEELPKYYGLDAFEMYSALKAHFTGSYDFILYNGKMKNVATNYKSKNNRGDSITAEAIWAGRLKQRYGKSLFEFLLANISKNPRIFLRDLYSGEQCKSVYETFVRRRESIFLTFDEEISQFCSQGASGDGVIRALVSNDGRPPEVLVAYRAGKLSPEVFIILDKVFSLFELYDKALEHDPIWERESFSLKKYRRFFDVDPARYVTRIQELCS
jgi:hypothetical protein